MSLNNVIPYWIYQLQSEAEQAKICCCFSAELYSGFTRSMPKHAILAALRRRKDTQDATQKDYESLL